MDDSLLTPKPLSPAVQATLLRDYNPFIHQFAGRANRCKLAPAGFGYDDWLQEARIALLDAGERFDPSRNVKFITFAYRWVWTRMLSAAKMRGRLVRVPANGGKKFSLYGEQACRKIEYLRAIHADSLPDPRAVDLDASDMELAAVAALATLPRYEREVMRRRCGFDGPPQKLDTIGEAMGKTRQAISQTQKRAVERLRKRMTP